MSQRAVEAALGKLICDDSFRRDFYQDAEAAAARAGFFLTPIELASLHKIEPEAIEVFVAHVDDRVRRAEAALRHSRPTLIRR
ncbi:MAG: hypothetical protein HY699_13150 [Deltaproteobacteria bacterium]|nr:hypothetical protein [Deltaproteobacteria bacterium]